MSFIRFCFLIYRYKLILCPPLRNMPPFSKSGAQMGEFMAIYKISGSRHFGRNRSGIVVVVYTVKSGCHEVDKISQFFDTSRFLVTCRFRVMAHVNEAETKAEFETSVMDRSPFTDLFHSGKLRELRLLLSHEIGHHMAFQGGNVTYPVFTSVTEL